MPIDKPLHWLVNALTAPAWIAHARIKRRSVLRGVPVAGEGRIEPVGLVLALVLSACIAALPGCASLPSQENRSVTSAPAPKDTAQTRLGRAVAADAHAHPELTGIYDLDKPKDAFAARLLLSNAADRSLDVQYYIWHLDHAGYLLMASLWKAAERGVRVRLLLDDNNTQDMDSVIAALDAHPNIEVRLYNPFASRQGRLLGFLTDFSRVNRRMHNKSFTADNQMSIVGGRNIGDEYFAVGDETAFVDQDLLVAGPVVQQISTAFDLFWNSASAYPAERLLPSATSEQSAQLQQAFSDKRADPVSTSYLEAMRSTPLAKALAAGGLSMQWVPVRLVHDDPDKTLDSTGRKDVLLVPRLARMIGEARSSLDLISPYFVPGDKAAHALAAIAKNGGRVRILTNSLAASDAFVTHVGYARHRLKLLRGGVRLYELKPTMARPDAERKGRAGSSSGVALHAKVFAQDNHVVFIGSFNIDQRSARLNTELGLVIESPALARELANNLERGLPGAAYEVRLAADNETIYWTEKTPTGEVHHDADPGASVWRRMGVDFLSILPIDWLL